MRHLQPLEPTIARPGLDRRTFLRLTAATSVGLSALLEACGTSIPLAPSAPTAAPRAGAATASGAASSSLPTYVPIQGPKPDLPGNDEGLQDGYFTYPKNPFKSVTQTPGLGTDVTAMTRDAGGPPPPLDQNAAWQAVNKQLNANMKLQIISPADYQARVATVMAGGEPPDLMYFMTGTQVTPGLPDYLKASFADLGPYLAGDAIKDYPNLAGLPPSSWKLTRYNNSIYGIPLPRPSVDNIWFTNQTRFDAMGLTQPKNKDDFKRLLVALTRPQMNQYGLGDSSSTLGLALTGRGDCPMAAMFGVPNNWAVDSSGKFTKDFETEQFKAALDFVRDLYASGVYYPDPLNGVTIKSSFLAGRYGVMLQGWSPYPLEFWNVGKAQNPPMEVRTLAPFSHDGGTPGLPPLRAEPRHDRHQEGQSGAGEGTAADHELSRRSIRQRRVTAAGLRRERRRLHVRRAGQSGADDQRAERPVRVVEVFHPAPAGHLQRHRLELSPAWRTPRSRASCRTWSPIRAWACFRRPTPAKVACCNMKVVDGLAEIVTGRAPAADLTS